jgi:RNase P/RNase MRP subunit POP5
LEEDDVKDAVWNAVFQLFGEYGASKAGLFLINYDKQKKEAVLRCSHKALPVVHAAIVSITKIKDKPAALHVLKISGTIKSLSKKRSP